ncbi:flagellar biosynthetic protein FliO [Acidiferrimicrobium sp. IK]|uniref:FliO/MopB family protein n=1 Tax=Acidiferrimicrobium sp. IK TaxID=2871700 RepID=UPI0021CB49A7|nr:flagellar biosynthetic protein FliO [Acidiferrimicrobium sp. IK]MCU4185017.1 flagellar biosynthetic protein FliO [Acidiferrimicrobium sp. IK]
MAFLLAAPAAPTAHTVSAWSLFAQLLIGLAVILAIIFVASKVLAGRGRLSLGANRRQTPMSVLARQSMGKGVSLLIVRAGTAVYLLGVTQHQVTRIDTLDPETLTDTQDGSYDPPASGAARPQANWGSWIRQLQERSVRR